MAMSEILLLEPVTGLGEEGECVRVRAGYARNFLVPHKKALVFSAANKNRIGALIRRQEERRQREREAAEVLARRFDGLRIVVAVRTGENGKMFGSVTAIDLEKELAERGLEIARDRIRLEQPLRELGLHDVEIRLHRDVRTAISVEIVSENPILTAAADRGQQ
ncbi:MAG: 50S ribosomal protein L9 [Puniceicoccales bacterium]|jgi:large subunit ribosomal protein L9|nr:50S ribosomal protein L9 [Puniceicoccales bacterium]